MKKIYSLVTFFALFSTPVFGHSGGLNAQGCHFQALSPIIATERLIREQKEATQYSTKIVLTLKHGEKLRTSSLNLAQATHTV